METEAKVEGDICRFFVRIETIGSVDPHPNAERLEIVQLRGWQVVVRKGVHKPGDKCVYIPIDSVINLEVASVILGPDSKIKLDNFRVKTIKIRGEISQGMIGDAEALGVGLHDVGTDVKEILGICKFEPPPHEAAGKIRKSRIENPFFAKYGGIDHYKNMPHVFKTGEFVYITEKIHGTNFRAGYVKRFDRPQTASSSSADEPQVEPLSKPAGHDSEHEFVYGSNNTQLQYSDPDQTDKNIYAEIVVKYDLVTRLQPGEVIYGEAYGDRVQKGYNYGCRKGEHKLVVFDLKIDGKYVDSDTLRKWCEERGFDCPPELFRGPYDPAMVKPLTKGPSVLCPSEKIREGIVIKNRAGRVLKFVSDDFLLTDPTDFH